ncbi:MAG: sigma-70 family RNA polymerase sigma factor [Planctomycetes bacterium]|nr:sigma-70 family RNA polymerase sigma factor [Planctomycetota bacterium]
MPQVETGIPVSSEAIRMAEARLSDEALVASLQGGDEDAFRQLVGRYKSPVASYFFRRVRDRGWAEDLAQEVFLRVYQKIGGFKVESRFSTWLFRIAHNLSIDFLKRKHLEPRLGLDGGSSSTGGGGASAVPGPEADPGVELQRRELGARVVETIEALGSKYRDVFLLCAMEGMSYEDAGEVLGLTPKTVSSRLCRARKKFKARIQPYLERAGA